MLKSKNVVVGHVNVFFCERLDNRTQQPKVQHSTNTSQYRKSMQHGKVVKDSINSGLQQGVSHMGGHVCAHVKSKYKHGSLLNDSPFNRFVHKNRFQPLFACDIESSIESKCPNEGRTCAGAENQTGGVSVVLSVKDGNKSVRGKKLNPFVHSNTCGKGEYFGNAKSSDSGLISVSRNSKAVNMIDKEQLTDNACGSASESANSAASQLLGVSRVSEVPGTGGVNETTSNVRKSTCDNSIKTGEAMADKYTLEVQTTMKKEKLKMARQAPDNRLSITQNTPLFGFIPIYGLKSQVIDKRVNAESTDILQLHKKLREDGRHNYRGLQVPVPSKLKPEAWARYLQHYWDWQLPLLIKFGFPLDFDRDSVIYSQCINHKSMTEYPDHVTVYLEEEL